jgi:hypothetical protein
MTYSVLNRKCVRLIFTAADFTMDFVKHILISLINIVGIPYSLRTFYSTFLMSDGDFVIYINDELSHYTPILSPVSVECRISDQCLIYYVEINIIDPQ